MDGYCLGLEMLGKCTYDQSSRMISLGDAIAGITLIITFTQLLTPTLKYRIKGYFPFLYSVWGASVVFVFVSFVVPFTKLRGYPLFGFPIFWEAVGALLIISSIIFILWKFSSRLKFSRNTVSRITAMVERIIATGDDKDQAELALALQGILPALVQNASRYDSLVREMLRREGREYAPPPLTLEAGHILRLCSDSHFCKAVVMREPAFAVVLFAEIKATQKYSSPYAKTLVQELVRQAFLSRDSILYREQSYVGLGLVQGFTNGAFSDSEFNEGALPLMRLHLNAEKDIDEATLNLLGEVLKLVTEAYLEARRFYEHSFSFDNSLGQLMSTVKFGTFGLDRLEKDEVYSSLKVRSLSSAADTLSEITKLFVESEQLTDTELLQYWENAKDDQRHAPYEYIANAYYEFFEGLTYTRKYDAELRSISVRLWLTLYPVSEKHENAVHREIQRRLEKRLFEQLKVNFEEGFYPAISRPLIALVGLQEPDKDVPGSAFKKRFLEYLSAHFLSLYREDSERAMDMVPSNVFYDDNLNRLVQRVRKGDERVLNLSV